MGPAPPQEPLDGAWSEYRRLVLAELERLNRELGEMDARLDTCRDSISRIASSIEKFRRDEIAPVQVDLALLKRDQAWTASIWGAIWGLVTGLAVAVVRYFTSSPSPPTTP